MTLKATRFLDDQSDKYDAYVAAARDYVMNLGNGAARWLREKPYDPTRGHKDFFPLMFNALNLIKAMHLPQGARVLEIGAGPGWLTEILLMLGYEVDAVEPAQDFVKIAQERLEGLSQHYNKKLGGCVRFHNQPVEESKLPLNTFDGVIFYDVLHHVIDERATLKTCFSALKPGGALGIVEGAWDPSFKDLEAALEEEMRRYGTLENPFTKSYLDQVLLETGFKAINRYISVAGFIPSFAESLPISSATWAPGFVRNDLIARKPFYPDGPEWGIRIEVMGARAATDSKRISIEVRVSNLGAQALVADGVRPGALSFALTREMHGNFEEASKRVPFEETILPGMTEEFQIVFDLRDEQDLSEWRLDVVCEQLFWFSSQGFDPIPLTLLE